MRTAIFRSALASVLLLAGCGDRPTPGPSTTSQEATQHHATDDSVVSSANFPSDAELDAQAKRERRQWRYDDGIPHVYNREAGKGRFIHVDGPAWKHVVDFFPDDAKDFEETSRTDGYVELKDWTGTQIYRLYDDRFECKPSHLPDFGKLGPGSWVPLPDPREVTQIVAERKFWRYENAPDIFPNQASYAGVFRQKDARFWEEQGVGSGTSIYEETDRTDDYVELAKLDGGFVVRLYADRSDWRYGNDTDFKPMFLGAWAGDGALPGTK